MCSFPHLKHTDIYPRRNRKQNNIFDLLYVATLPDGPIIAVSSPELNLPLIDFNKVLYPKTIISVKSLRYYRFTTFKKKIKINLQKQFFESWVYLPFRLPSDTE